MSLTKEELRPEEGPGEEERDERYERFDLAEAWEKGVRSFAVWKDGMQRTAMGRPLSEALKLNPYR